MKKLFNLKEWLTITDAAKLNLKNLAPSCNKCNSGNKQDKDPLHSSTGERRKAFYPFSAGLIENLIAVDIHSDDWTTPKKDDLTITLSSATHPEEVETWEELFRIKQTLQRKMLRCWWRFVLAKTYNRGIRELWSYTSENVCCRSTKYQNQPLVGVELPEIRFSRRLSAGWPV